MKRATTTSATAAGGAAERVAASFLRERGYHVLEHNFRCRGGEIDLIALDGSTLVFVEVKLRRTLSRGAPIEAVTPLKQARVQRAAQCQLRLGVGAAVRLHVRRTAWASWQWIRLRCLLRHAAKPSDWQIVPSAAAG